MFLFLLSLATILISDGDNQIKYMAWKFAGCMRIWGGTNFSGELILYYRTNIVLQAECVCVFIPFHLLVSSGCMKSLTYVRSSDQRSFVVSISWLCYAKFHHRHIWKCHISPPKTKTPAALLLERKRYDILMLREKMIYIDIGNKSARTKPRSYKKILKIRRLLWSKFFNFESSPWHKQ